jgi:hypothetical protein
MPSRSLHKLENSPVERGHSLVVRNRIALAITETELKLIAATAIMGLRSKPVCFRNAVLA